MCLGILSFELFAGFIWFVFVVLLCLVVWFRCLLLSDCCLTWRVLCFDLIVCT